MKKFLMALLFGASAVAALENKQTITATNKSVSLRDDLYLTKNAMRASLSVSAFKKNSVGFYARTRYVIPATKYTSQISFFCGANTKVDLYSIHNYHDMYALPRSLINNYQNVVGMEIKRHNKKDVSSQEFSYGTVFIVYPLKILNQVREEGKKEEADKKILSRILMDNVDAQVYCHYTVYINLGHMKFPGSLLAGFTARGSTITGHSSISPVVGFTASV